MHSVYTHTRKLCSCYIFSLQISWFALFCLRTTLMSTQFSQFLILRRYAYLMIQGINTRTQFEAIVILTYTSRIYLNQTNTYFITSKRNLHWFIYYFGGLLIRNECACSVVQFKAILFAKSKIYIIDKFLSGFYTFGRIQNAANDCEREKERKRGREKERKRRKSPLRINFWYITSHRKNLYLIFR